MKVTKTYNIKEDYCSFEVAKLLKEHGFEFEHTPYNSVSYWQNGEENHWGDNEDCVYSPLLQMAVKWLRVVMNVWVWVEPFATTVDGVTDLTWCYYYKKRLKMGNNYTGCCSKHSVVEYSTPEEALDNAIKYVLENLDLI